MRCSRRRFLHLAGIVAAPAAAPGAPDTARRLSSFDPVARHLLASLSLEEKAGQMTQPDQMYLKSPDDVAAYHLGSVLSGGDSDPKSGNDLASWTGLYESLQRRALASRSRIPLLYGIDSVHGNSNLTGAVVFPHNKIGRAHV